MASKKADDASECFLCDFFWRSQLCNQILEIVTRSHKREKLRQKKTLSHNKRQIIQHKTEKYVFSLLFSYDILYDFGDYFIKTLEKLYMGLAIIMN